MTDDTHSRRTYLSIIGATGTVALAGCVASGQPDFGDCVPPGQYECPGENDELIAVLEFDGCSVTQAEGECDISINVTESEADGGSCEAFSFEVVDTDGCSISAIRVYGGSDCEDYVDNSEDDESSLPENGDGNIEITTNLNAGQSDERAAISNIRCCGTLDDGEDGDDGQDGEDGDDGQDGEDGDDGQDGEDGDDGQDGEDGDDGQDGEDGEDGQDGEDGEDGQDGEDGEDGQDGEDGEDGQDGEDGEDGQDGEDGEDGQDGEDGEDGQDGEDGEDGQDGEDGEDGQDGENGEDGQDGDDGEDEDDGQDGEDGEDGDDGQDGDDGEDGQDGEDGDDGQDGDDGEDGQDDEKNKKPDVDGNVDLTAVCREGDDSSELKCKLSNETDHSIKFSWGVDNATHGGKITVGSGSSETFYATADEDATVYLYHDGDTVDSVDAGVSTYC